MPVTPDSPDAPVAPVAPDSPDAPVAPVSPFIFAIPYAILSIRSPVLKRLILTL